MVATSIARWRRATYRCARIDVGDARHTVAEHGALMNQVTAGSYRYAERNQSDRAIFPQEAGATGTQSRRAQDHENEKADNDAYVGTAAAVRAAPK